MPIAVSFYSLIELKTIKSYWLRLVRFFLFLRLGLLNFICHWTGSLTPPASPQDVKSSRGGAGTFHKAMVSSPSVWMAGGDFVSSVHVVRFESLVRVIRPPPWRSSVKHPATHAKNRRGALFLEGCLRFYCQFKLGELAVINRNDTLLGWEEIVWRDVRLFNPHSLNL